LRSATSNRSPLLASPVPGRLRRIAQRNVVPSIHRRGNEGVAFVLDLREQKHAEDALWQTQEDLGKMQAEFAHVNRVMTRLRGFSFRR
jgi:hypothetical protein